MKSKIESTKSVTLFESRQIRRTWHNDRWYFVVEDVVLALTNSQNVKDYITKMKERDSELSQGYGQIVSTLDIMTKGGRQKMSCADLEGIFRIIQSIPSPKAEPFKRWLAKVGKERLDEIRDPEPNDSKGFPRLQNDAKLGGAVAGRTRKDIEKQTKSKSVSDRNFLPGK